MNEVKDRICRECKVLKVITEYYINRKSGKDGYQTICMECDKKKRRKWYQDNKERSLRDSRAYAALISSGITVDLQEKRERRRVLAKRIQRKFRLKTFYQMTPEEFDRMFESQGCRCAMCGADDPKGSRKQWMVDHDHACCPDRKTCGKCIRGIVCAACNTALGVYERIKEKAEVYLQRYTTKIKLAS